MSDCRAQHDGEGRLSLERRYPEGRIRVSRKQARMTRAGRREQPVAQLEQRVGIAIWRTAQRYRRRRRTAKPLRDNRQQARMTRASRSEEQAKKSMANSRQGRACPTAGIERHGQQQASKEHSKSGSRPATSSRSSVVQQTQVHPKCKERHVEMAESVRNRRIVVYKNAFWNRGSARS